MMELTVLGSSSSGNGYVIQSETEAIIIEAGVGLIQAKATLKFDVSKVSACLISHEHGDHCKYADKYEKFFPTFAPKSVIDACNLTRTTEVLPMIRFKAGRFSVLPFYAHHDCVCMGYVIGHPEIGNLMFLTDSFVSEFSFKGLNHIMIECNYDDKTLAESIENGITSRQAKPRLMMTHMELQTTKKVILSQGLSEVQTITLLHSSSRNSDRDVMLSEVSGATGKRVFIAAKDLVVDMSCIPY